jgi:cob(I)alamin adenosyltransferase
MKIYTKTGDEGETGLWGGDRVLKDHVRIEACGAIDELNAFLGLARAETLPQEVHGVLDRVQHELFVLGAEVAAPRGSLHIAESRVAQLEQDIDGFDSRLPPLHNFILPGGVRSAATLHAARTVCRRAERRVVHLAATPEQPVSETALCYLNRLGDLLFVLARYANASAGLKDVVWRASEDGRTTEGDNARG